jgi:hypothetical protein
MNRRVGEDRGSKEMDGCSLTCMLLPNIDVTPHVKNLGLSPAIIQLIIPNKQGLIRSSQHG